MRIFKDLIYTPLFLLLLIVAILLKIKTLLLSPKQFWVELTTKKSYQQWEPKPFRSNNTEVIDFPTNDGMSRIEYGSNYKINSKSKDYTLYFEFHGEPRAFADATYGMYYNDQATVIDIWQGPIAHSSGERYIAASAYPSRETIIIDPVCKAYTQTKDFKVADISKLNDLQIESFFPFNCWKSWADQALLHNQT